MFAKVFVDVFNGNWNRLVANCEGDPALMLTANTTVFVVGTGASAFISVNMIFRTALGRHGVDVTAE
jgi:hypothetical protein